MSDKRKKLIMNVDFFDELALHWDRGFMDAGDVEELVATCAGNGIDSMFWRANGLGTAGYPSKIVGSAEWARTADFSLSVARMSKKEQEAYAASKGEGEPWQGRLTATLERMDPIAEARDACRRHGIDFFIWLDIIDERRGKFLNEHPECLVLGRDGKTVWPGLRDYANDAAVANELAVVEELLAYKPDGLYLSTSCHTRHLNFPEPEDFFGFGPETVAAYKRATGRGVEEGEFDAVKWHSIKGDFFTEFLRNVKARAKAVDAKVAVGTQFGPYTNLTSPYFDGDVKFRFETQWKRWIDEEIADALILGDYEWPWDGVPTWQPKGYMAPKGKQIADVLAGEYVAYSRGRADLYFFSSWLSAYAQHHNGASAADLDGAMRMRALTILDTAVDGICLHEAHTFEYYKGFDTIAEMRKTLDSGIA